MALVAHARRRDVVDGAVEQVDEARNASDARHLPRRGAFEGRGEQGRGLPEDEGAGAVRFLEASGDQVPGAFVLMNAWRGTGPADDREIEDVAVEFFEAESDFRFGDFQGVGGFDTTGFDQGVHVGSPVGRAGVVVEDDGGRTVSQPRRWGMSQVGYPICPCWRQCGFRPPSAFGSGRAFCFTLAGAIGKISAKLV